MYLARGHHICGAHGKNLLCVSCRVTLALARVVYLPFTHHSLLMYPISSRGQQLWGQSVLHGAQLALTVGSVCCWDKYPAYAQRQQWTACSGLNIDCASNPAWAHWCACFVTEELSFRILFHDFSGGGQPAVHRTWSSPRTNFLTAPALSFPASVPWTATLPQVPLIQGGL